MYEFEKRGKLIASGGRELKRRVMVISFVIVCEGI